MMHKINIPMVMLCADTAMGKGYDSIKGIYRIGPMHFRQWFSYFFAECYEEYGQYCSSGGIKKEKGLKRIELMEQSLKEYFELDAVEESVEDSEISSADISDNEAVSELETDKNSDWSWNYAECDYGSLEIQKLIGQN